MNEEGLNFTQATFMVVAAVLIDVFQIGLALIPLVGILVEWVITPIIDIGVLFLYWLWFKSNGIDIYAGRNYGGTLLALVAEIVPGLNIVLPGWTVWVLSMVLFGKRMEE